MPQIRRKVGGVVLAALAGVSIAGVVHQWRRGAPAREAKRTMAELRVLPAWRIAADLFEPRFDRRSEVTAAPIPTPEAAATKVTLSPRANEPAHVEDLEHEVAMNVTLMDTFDVAAQTVDGYAVYPKAHRSGATLLERALPDGTEDYLSFETRPAKPEVSYQLALGDGVSGLRLVADTLELLDDDGAPRLRVAPPFIVGADGVRTDATLALEGCAADVDASAPWGRPVTAAGASVCTVRVQWPDESVVYPAVLDPRWTTTHAMTTTRQGHTATLLPNGKVLVVGGTSNGSTALASAEMYDRRRRPCCWPTSRRPFASSSGRPRVSWPRSRGWLRAAWT